MDCYNTIQKILKYLRYTLNYELYYTSYQVVLERYIDVNLMPNIK